MNIVPLSAIQAYLLPIPASSSRILPAARKRSLFLKLRIRRDIFRVCCSNLNEDKVESLVKEDTQNSEGGQWAVFKPWDVPWDWKVTAYIMLPYLMSLKSVAKLSVLYIFVSRHKPLPDDVFSLEWGSPFNFKNGWILWAVGGLTVASFVAFVVKAFISGLYAGRADNETEPLVRLLPMIGSSNISTVCLLGTVGIFAPICEEVLYRGFLLASLTKWFPVTLSVVVSSTIFTLAHQSPGKSLEIFIFGTVLGLIYAQTKNLLVPITMHALWNCGVILILAFIHSQGDDMHKYVL